MTRTLINESKVKKYFWVEEINTYYYVLNRVSIRKILNKTPYELWKNGHLLYLIFVCLIVISIFLIIYIIWEYLIPSHTKGIFLGYFLTSKGYRVYHLRNQPFEESMHVVFDKFHD